MGNLEGILAKGIITLEELQEIEEIEGVETEDNGMSGLHVDHHWYTAKVNNEEYDLYVKTP